MADLRSETGATRTLIELVRRGFHSVGVDVRRHRPDDVVRLEAGDIFRSLLALRERALSGTALDDELAFLEFCANNVFRSHSQLMQDLFVLYQCRNKRGGFFVDFGATDGVSINNTVLLERGYAWTGVLAEPARCWHQRLRANRTCAISTDCVWRASGEVLLFNETSDQEYSTIESMSSGDSHAAIRTGGQRYDVRTISLVDLLEQTNAPRRIDYLSVDTEGSEIEILVAFDFEKYDVGIITVEHNYTPNRLRLEELLRSNGYVRKFETLSQWDDWYVRV